MSIPERLWRILRGRVLVARERAQRGLGEADAALARAREQAEQRRAVTDAARELAASTGAARRSAAPPSSRPPASPEAGAGNVVDPMARYYQLLQLAPGPDLATLESAYQARLAETRPERHPEGSAERALVETRRRALEEAYDRLRDVLNSTETRFEKLEF